MFKILKLVDSNTLNIVYNFKGYTLLNKAEANSWNKLNFHCDFSTDPRILDENLIFTVLITHTQYL
jgi:hypothetical protein